MEKLNICTILFILIFSISNCLAQLRTFAEKHNKYVGVAIDPISLKDNSYSTLLDREFDSITAENAMKWHMIEQSYGHPNYTNSDIIVHHGMKAKQKIRGHNLLWPSHVPQWLPELHLTSNALKSLIEKHVTAEVTHYKGHIYAWDVINEPLEDNGTFRHKYFYEKLGKDYIKIALKAARSADSHAKLYINDYSIESINTKSTSMLNFIKELKSENVPIDGVGFQCHFESGRVPHDLQKNLQRFTEIGIDVAITELDIRIKLPVDSTKLQKQADEYKTIVHACRSLTRCVGISMWGVSDKHSWVPGFYHGYGSPLIFDEHFKEKPAYVAMKEAFH